MIALAFRLTDACPPERAAQSDRAGVEPAMG
jgi:hypothetical protein